MSFKQNTLVLIALPDELRIVDVCPEGEALFLRDAVTLRCQTRSQDSFALSDPSIVTRLKDLVASRSWQDRSVTCFVGGSNVACQYFDIPPLKGPALRQAVELKLGQQLHFEVSAAVVDITTPRSVNGDVAANRVAVTAIHRDIANTVIRATEQADLKLRTISAAPSSITWLVKDFLQGQSGMAASLYVDEHQSTLVVVHDGIPCVTSELPIGIAEFTTALMRPIIAGENVVQLDEQQAREIRNQIGIPQANHEIASLKIKGEKLLPLIEPALQKITKQLTQWLSFASTCVSGAQVKNLTLVGPGAHLPGLADAISARVKVTATAQHWLRDVAEIDDGEFSSADVSCEDGSSPIASDAGSVITDGGGRARLLESLAVAVGAAKSAELPDLLPPEIKRQRKVARIRSSISICGPIVAAAALAYAVLFQSVGSDLTGDIAARQAQLASVAKIVDDNSKWVTQQDKIARIERDLADFSKASPSWMGIFKELSILLPRELRATQYSAVPSDGNLALNVTASVYSGADGRGFDETVSQTLQLLQRSAFFSRVELISANRADQGGAPGSSGVLNLRLDLIYPRARLKT
jgi:Tfp pilus assembly PilM family ATPase